MTKSKDLFKPASKGNCLKFLIWSFAVLLNLELYAQTTSTTKGCVPFVVQFDGTGYFWEFGNSQESSEANPTTVYNAAGTYSVNVYQFKNGPSVNSFDIEVYDIPAISINASVVKGCEPLEVDFSYTLGATSVPINGANWIFGDGSSVSSTGTDVTHTYTKGGNFSVSLELETGLSSCQINTVRTNFIEVIDRPEANFSITPESSCTAPVTISLTNNSSDALPVSYAWDFGNGSTSTLSSPSDQTFTTEGAYDIQLVATNTEGCRDTTVVTLNVGSPVGIIDVPDTLCLDLGTRFEYFAARRVDWDFGADAMYYEPDSMNLQPITTSREKSIEIFYTAGGTKTITLTTNNDGCSNTVTKDIYVQEIQINPSISEVSGCTNPINVDYSATTDARSPSYEWTFSDNSIQNIVNPSFTYYDGSDTVFYGVNTEIIHTAQLIVTDGVTGCYDSAFVDFTHSPVNAKVLLQGTSTATGCAPYTVSFMDSVSTFITDPIIEWVWDYGDGSAPETHNASTTVSHTYTSSGVYDVTLSVENASGCTDTSFPVRITVGQDISSSLAFTADQTNVCRGDTVELSVTSSLPNIDAFHFYSDGQRLFHQQSDSVVKWAFSDETGFQDVTLMVESAGCLSEITYTDFIMVNGAVAEIEFGSTCTAPYTYDFKSLSTSGSGSLNLTWDFGDGNTSSASTPTHTYAARGDFEVFLTAEDPSSGCAVHKDSVMVHVREPQAVLTAPSFACGGGEITLKASGSQDAACRGYTFRFPTFGDFQRPITWDKDSAVVFVPDVDTVGNSHTVELIITDDNGCKDTTSTTIEPYILDVQASTTTTELCNSQTITLTDLTTSDQPLASWSWVISNGDTLTSQSPIFTASVPPLDNDTFYITLQVEDVFGCVSSNTDTLLSLAYEPLDARLRVLTDSICAPDMVDFEGVDRDGRGLDFNWDFGNSTNGVGALTSGSYASGGNYNVNMVFSESTTGCIDSIQTTVRVQESPVAGFLTDRDMDSVLCNPQIITFTDSSATSTSIASLFWDFGNGETSNTPSYTLSYPKGTYDVSLTARTSYGCDNTTTRTFEVVGPEATFTMDDNEICEGQEILFEVTSKTDVDSLVWIFGDGADLSDVDSVSHTYGSAPTSLQTITNLLLYSDNGCFQALNDTIVFHEVVAGFDLTNDSGVIDSLLCVDDLVLTVDNSINGDIYGWDFGDGSSSSEVNPQTSYSSQGTYSVTQYIENTTWGCSDSLTRTLTIEGLPDAGLQLSHDTLCLGETLSASVAFPNDSSTYSWDPIGLASSAITMDPQSTFTLSLTETNYAGCVSYLDSSIVVIQPYAYNAWDTTIQEGKTARLPIILDSLHTFDLDPLDGLSCLDCNYPIVAPLEDITYELRIRDNYGCFDDTYDLTVFVIPPSFISMPKSFTPNGDGINDIIYVKGWYIQELKEYSVFNRWGELIFSTTDLDEGWDGKFNGKLQKSDVYVYKVRVLGVDGNIVYKEGYLNLIN